MEASENQTGLHASGGTEWDRIAASQQFQDLLALKKVFIVPAFIFFCAYYFLLPVLVGFASEADVPASDRNCQSCLSFCAFAICGGVDYRVVVLEGCVQIRCAHERHSGESGWPARGKVRCPFRLPFSSYLWRLRLGSPTGRPSARGEREHISRQDAESRHGKTDLPWLEIS